jgi:hypothetical protein
VTALLGQNNYFSAEAKPMKIETVHVSFETIVSEAKSELKSRVLCLSAHHGYHIADLTLFFDDAGFMPGVRVALRPMLSYDKQELFKLEVELENDLNNFIFDYVYNSRRKIGAEDSSRVMRIPHIGECISQLVIASQN